MGTPRPPPPPWRCPPAAIAGQAGDTTRAQPHGTGVLTGFPGKPIPGEPGFPGGPGSPASPSGPTRPGSPWKAREGVSAGATAGCPHPPAPQAPTYLLALGAHHANLPGPTLPGGEQSVKAQHVQRRARHGAGWSSGQTLPPRGAPGDAQVLAGTTHVTPRAPRLALQSPVALLTLLALWDRRTSPVPSPMLPHLAPSGPGTSAGIPGPTGQSSLLRCRDPRGGWTHLLPIGTGCPRDPLRGKSGAKWVPTGGLVQGFPPARATAPFIPPPPPELSPRGRTPTPQPGVRTRRGGGSTAWSPRRGPIRRASLTTSPRCPFSPCGPSAHWGGGGGGSGVRGGSRAGGGGTQGVGRGLTCTGPPGWVRTQSAPCESGEGAQGLCLHRPWPRTGGHGGQERSPGRRDPRVPGTPAGSTPRAGGVPAGDAVGDTHAVAFLPLAAGGAGQAALALPTLQERGGGGDEVGKGCPHGHTGAHNAARSARAGVLRAQPRVCVATSLPELGSACPGGVTNLPLDPADRA